MRQLLVNLQVDRNLHKTRLEILQEQEEREDL